MKVIYGDAQVGLWQSCLLSSSHSGNFDPYSFKLDGFKYTGAPPHPTDGKIISYRLHDISTVEPVTQQNAVSVLGGAAGAAIGGLFLGPVGAVAGMLAGGRSEDSVIKITLSDGAWFVCRLSSGTAELLHAAAYENQKARASSIPSIVYFSQREYDSPSAVAAREKAAAKKAEDKKGCLIAIGIVFILLLLARSCSSTH